MTDTISPPQDSKPEEVLQKTDQNKEPAPEQEVVDVVSKKVEVGPVASESAPVPEIETSPKKADALTGQVETPLKKEPVVEVAPVHVPEIKEKVEAISPSAPKPTPKKADALTGLAPTVISSPPPTPSPAPKASEGELVSEGQAKMVDDSLNNTIIQPVLSFLDKLKELRGRANTVRHKHVEENLKKVEAFAKENGGVTNDDVERLTGVKDTQATNYLNNLVKQGKLIRTGEKSNTIYKPTGN